MDGAEHQITDLEHKEASKQTNKQTQKPTLSEQEEKRIQNNEDSINSLWDKFKRSNIHLIGVPEGEEKEQETGNLFRKIMKENFTNSVKEIDMQVQEAQRVPNKLDAKRPTPNTS